MKSELDNIKRQYDPVWKALQPCAIKSYEGVKAQFQHKLKHFCDLLEIAPPPSDIVELACGSGIAAVELARRGYNVIGIDCSAEAIAVAKILEEHLNTEVCWQKEDMRSFHLDHSVDYILLWDVVFGIFASEQEDFKVLQQISKNLKVGGRCLFQFYNKDFAVLYGVEDCYIYDRTQDLFVRKEADNPLPIKKIKLYSGQEWLQMLRQVQLKIVREDTSRLLDDPEHGPARVHYLVAEKSKKI